MCLFCRGVFCRLSERESLINAHIFPANCCLARVPAVDRCHPPKHSPPTVRLLDAVTAFICVSFTNGYDTQVAFSPPNKSNLLITGRH